jgi:thiosulfate/3-mercaptopyruvate sulfurtransferase
MSTNDLTTQLDVLVSPAWLAAHLDDPAVRVVEVDVNRTAYDTGHIDGAVLWNIYTDLKDADYALLDDAAFEAILHRSGIGPESTIVFYGYGPALGFWLMKLYSHSDVRVLDASRDTWREAGRPWTTDQPHPVGGHYRLGQPDRRIRADYGAVRAAIDNDATTLVDVRTEAEYTGERFWPSGAPEDKGRAGHVPTAVHASLEGLHAADGSFRSPPELRRILAAGNDDRDLITYCTIGNRAAIAWFAWTYLLGRPNVRVYDGSWAQWGRTTDAPVAVGWP